MRRQQARWRQVAWVGLAVVLTACATGRAANGLGTPVTITGVAMVAGRWEGLMSPETGRERDDFIEVTLGENQTYEAKTARTVGVMDGRGTYQLRDGKLLLQGPRSTGTATLREKDGRRVLTVEVTTRDGLRYSARLSPKR